MGTHGHWDPGALTHAADRPRPSGITLPSFFNGSSVCRIVGSLTPGSQQPEHAEGEPYAASGGAGPPAKALRSLRAVAPVSSRSRRACASTVLRGYQGLPGVAAGRIRRNSADKIGTLMGIAPIKARGECLSHVVCLYPRRYYSGN
jgi:hypothetical protein